MKVPECLGLTARQGGGFLEGAALVQASRA